MGDNSIPPRIESRLRLFERLLISYSDFHHASRIATYILEHRLQDKVERLRGQRRYRIRLLWQALSCAMIMAYCRPFSGNDRRTSRQIPDLPSRFLKGFTPEEAKVHKIAMSDRNTLLAHSDSDALNMQMYFYKGPTGMKTLVPLHQQGQAALVDHAVRTLNGICVKLMEQVFTERMEMERELADYIPVVTDDQKSLSEEDHQ